MDGFGWLISVVGFVLVLIALNKISKLDTRIAQLKLQLGQFADELSQLRQSPQEPPKTEEKKSKRSAAAAKSPEPVLAEAPTPEPVVEVAKIPELPAEPLIKKFQAPKRDMEQALASRWFVWIGGVAIAIGGLLFVKYAYDNGLISPRLQIFLGLLMGAGLILAGDRLRRKTMESDYVPAALSAAGLAIAFASIYAAYALYELVGPTTDFIGLALVGLGALALSLRQGPLIAALGILGSYVTPMLITSPDPSGWSFFPYLLVILGASFAVLHKRPWWWLGYASIVGSALWSFLWIGGPFEIVDILPLGLFALCIGAISIFAISGRAILASNTGSLLSPMGMTELSENWLRWSSCGLSCSGRPCPEKQSYWRSACAVFYRHGGRCGALLVQAGRHSRSTCRSGFIASRTHGLATGSLHRMGHGRARTVVKYVGWRGPPFLRWMLATGAAFTALGLAGVFRKTPPLTWAVLAAGSAALFLFGAWGRVDGLLSDSVWALIGCSRRLSCSPLFGFVGNKSQAANDNLAAGILAVAAPVFCSLPKTACWTAYGSP